MTESRPAIKDLILVPSVITLAITLLRLVGELQNWAPGLFSKAAGGGGALIGISWLIFVFGAIFGWRLTRMGRGAASPLKAAGGALVIMLIVGVVSAAGAQIAGTNGFFGAFILASIVATFLARSLWPALWQTLFAYGLAARIPVALVMLVAILGNWGTHYDVAPPNFPATYSPFVKWVLIGLLPQMTFWIFLTVIGGLVAGGIAGAIAGRKS